MTVYINRRSIDHRGGNHRGVETIDECQTLQEAYSLVREYTIADYAAYYYVSRRPTKAWRESQFESHLRPLTNNMANTIQIRLNGQDDSQWKEVPTKWKGKALAVHRPVVDGELSNKKCYWAITHIETGLDAAILNAPIKFVRKLSAAWDNVFSSIHTQEDIVFWPYTQEWKDQSNGLSPIVAPDSVEAIINRYAN